MVQVISWRYQVLRYIIVSQEVNELNENAMFYETLPEIQMNIRSFDNLGLIKMVTKAQDHNIYLLLRQISSHT